MNEFKKENYYKAINLENLLTSFHFKIIIIFYKI